jgi:long-chain acyl-CoA synthetase
MPAGKKLTKDDCYISYLPLPHSFEQTLFVGGVVIGIKIGFFSGNVLKIIDDLSILKPTCFPTVPRLFNKIFCKI